LHDEEVRQAREQLVHEKVTDWERAQTGWHSDSEWLIYYVRRESDDLIKIGTSRVFRSRLTALRAEHGPLRVLLTHAGSYERENLQHARFAHLWAEGEWFRPGRQLCEWILETRAHGENIATALRGTEPVEYIRELLAVSDNYPPIPPGAAEESAA
jgi:hypothetical protein